MRHDYIWRKPAFDHFRWLLTIYDTTIFGENPFLTHFWSFFGPKNIFFINFYLSFDHLAISFASIYDATLFEEKNFFESFWSLFGLFWAILGPKSEDFQKKLRKPWSPSHKLFKDVWFDYIKKKPFLTLFLVLFWAILGPKIININFFYKSWDHLIISFPMIYDTTILEGNPLLTLFGPYLGRFGPKNEDIDTFLWNL